MFAMSVLSKKNICLRECVKIVECAKKSGCKISLIHQGKIGTNESMLSLACLGILKGDGLVVKLEGPTTENESQAYKELSNIFL
jgi:phosphotransferase system HPr-like phosphotransfer protein